jgi:hypothetical protein
MGFVPGCHEEILAEYAVSGDPNVADPNSEIILFRFHLDIIGAVIHSG